MNNDYNNYDYDDIDHERYTADEIEEMFRNQTGLNEDFKNTVLQKLSALCQAMYNLTQEDKRMNIRDTYGDFWQEEYNRIATEYQRYHN